MTDHETILWESESVEVREHITVPAWINTSIDANTVMAVIHAGCVSGAYMPAVTYHEAMQTMAEYGDDVLDFIQETLGELPTPPDDVSWSGLSVHYLSCAVELWAGGIMEELAESIKDNS